MTSHSLSETPTAETALGLYVHVPFCRSKCRYCDFCSHPPAPGEIALYARALESEVRLRATDRPAGTLYFGGGTPSFLGSDRLCALLELFRHSFRLEPDCEITVEANPADVTGEWLAACRAAGVNRLSLGVQGMRGEDLRFLERAHSTAEAVAAGRRAREAGFDNLGIDLIVGLPGHSPAITKAILSEAVAAFAPEHLSCYQLTCTPGTRLYEAVKRGEVRMPDSDAEAAIFMTTHETCEALGYEGYEVSNFARTRALRSRHNSAYWSHRDYLGFGPAAHSFLNPVRAWNTKSLAQYAAALERAELPAAGQERLTPLQLAAEIILLGLRTRDGFSPDRLRGACGFDLLAENGDFLADAVSQGLLRRESGRILPTLAGMAVADSLAVGLAPWTAAGDSGTERSEPFELP